MLPATWRLRLDPGTRRVDDGRVLVGGAPLRLLRFNEAGASIIEELAEGIPIGDAPTRQQLARRLLDGGMAHPVPDRATRSSADVTVVVPTYPSAAGLAETLEHLGPVAGCVVVDDATSDPEVEQTATRFGADFARHDVNRGPAAARNTGWRLATTDLVAFVDPRCTPQPGWLDRLLPHFDDPAVVAVAPRITSRVLPSLSAGLAAYERARPSLDRGPTEGLVRPRGRVPFVPSTALLLRRSALEASGGFDEALRLGEDVDMVWRLVASGGTVRYEPGSEVAHESRGTARAWLRQRFGYGTSAAALSERHGSAVAPLAISAWTAAAWTLVGAGAPRAGLAVAVGSSAALAPRLNGLDHPWRESARLAGLGHLHGGPRIGDALRRPWWPIALAAGLLSRRARRGVAVAMIVPLLIEWCRDRPPLDPVRWVGLRLADDVAYGTGVWAGCLRARSFGALRPDLTSWPGRKRAVEAGGTTSS